MMTDFSLDIIDDFTHDKPIHLLSDIEWQLVTDNVMGGMSKGQLSLANIEGRSCLRMQGEVSLENNGGFVQVARDLPDNILNNIVSYKGLMLEVYGNDERYNVHLRTQDIVHPWQSYRASINLTPKWQSLYLPFAEFSPYRIDKELDISCLTRMGLVAIGRQFNADLCLGKIGLYR